MKPIQACLTPEILRRFTQDELTATELQIVEEHLNGCPQCRSLLENAESDDFWRQQIAPVLQSSPELRADSAIDAQQGGDELLNVVLRLLGPTDDPRMLGRIGSYEIVGIIGRGGMGVVFKAFDGALNRYVAIKMLSPNLAELGAARKRFAREGQAAAAVIDDHVLPIYGVAEWQGVPYLVMQYSRGVTLQKRVEDQGPLELKEILRIGMQTARGLAAAHALGLVHRDVKPSNILIDGTVERALLTDFGLARAVDDASITRTGMIAGTPQYMSPEQARGVNVNASSDLFSLGGVLYFMATGRQPFRADNSYAILRLIVDQEPKNMREINPDLPAWLCTLTSHLMAKAPGDRPASAEEVAEILQRCLAHVQQPASVPLADTVYRPKAGSGSQQRGWLLPTRLAFSSLVSLVAILLVAGLNLGRVEGLLVAGSALAAICLIVGLNRATSDASKTKSAVLAALLIIPCLIIVSNTGTIRSGMSAAVSALKSSVNQAPDITGHWTSKDHLNEQFLIQRVSTSPQTLEICPLHWPSESTWSVQWAPERNQFEGTAIIPGGILGTLKLSITPQTTTPQLDVALTLDELQNRRLLKQLSEDVTAAASAEVRLIEMLDRLRYQTWLRDESYLPSKSKPVTKPDAKAAATRPPEGVDDESAFRGFDSDSVSEGASATWQKYVQWWNATNGTPLEPSAEIPRLAWATPVARLNPKVVYTHGSNVVIVRSIDESGEEGIYVVLGIASGPGPNDGQFIRTLIAHAPRGDVYTFRRKGSFGRPSQSVRARTDRVSDAIADTAEPAESQLTPDTRKAIDAGLEYLARNQREDGSWNSSDYRGNVAVTALAGRAFLTAGDQPGRGPNGARLTNAIDYILRNEDGGLLAEGRSAPMCEHGEAVHFLAEAYDKVTDHALRDRMKGALLRAVKVIAESQNREGGWRYTRTPRDADISVTSCQLHALAAAKRAGFEVPQATIDNGISYILGCLDLHHGDRFRYMSNAPTAAPAAFEYTAAAISSLNAASYDGNKELLERGTAFIRNFQPSGAVEPHFYEARYYAAAVMKATGGQDWDRWYSAVGDDLLKRQNTDGAWGDAVHSSCFDTALVLIIQSSR